MDDKQKGWSDKVRYVKIDRKKFVRRVRKAKVVTTKHAHRFVIGRINNIRLVSREVTTWLVFVGVLIAGLGIQILWSQNSYMAMAPQPGGTYVEGVLGRIDTLNPLFSSSDSESSVARLVFSSLYDYDKTGTLHQDLATNMSIDSTQKVYTITLRDDAKWHDGESVTAEDVVFTVNLMRNASTRYPLRTNWIDVSAKALNSVTVQFTLPAVYAAFPQALTFSILPEHALKQIAPSAIRESVFSQDPMGSGPFKFSRLQQTNTSGNYKVVHFVSNQEYYRGAPKLSRFELRSYPTEKDLVQAVNNGAVSGATDISVTGIKDINKKLVKVTPTLLDSGMYLMLNMQNPELQDIAVRQALQLASDTTSIRNSIKGGVLPLDGPLLNGQLANVTLPKPPVADVAKANQILETAGWIKTEKYRTKDGKALELTITTTKDSEYEAVLAIVKAQWKKIGVKVNTNVVDTSSSTSTFIQNTLQGRNFDVLLYELAVGADPDVYAYWHSSQIGLSGYNFSNYSSKAADASLASARSRIETDLRNAKYTLFVQQWLADIPAIALYQPVIEYVTVKGVNAVESDSHLVTNADRYADIVNWTVNSGDSYKTP